MKSTIMNLIIGVCLVVIAVSAVVIVKNKDKGDVVELPRETVEPVPTEVASPTYSETETIEETETYELYTGPVILGTTQEDETIEIPEDELTSEVVIPDEQFFDVTGDLLTYYQNIGLWDDLAGFEATEPFSTALCPPMYPDTAVREGETPMYNAIMDLCTSYVQSEYPGHCLVGYWITDEFRLYESDEGDVVDVITIHFLNSNMVWEIHRSIHTDEVYKLVDVTE